MFIEKIIIWRILHLSNRIQSTRNRPWLRFRANFETLQQDVYTILTETSASIIIQNHFIHCHREMMLLSY